MNSPVPRPARPKKRYGQHFLSDPSLLGRIVDQAGIGAGDSVLEVGPGLGSLTDEIAARGANVLAVEIDPEMVAVLRERFTARANVRIVETDAAMRDPGDLLRECGLARPYTLIGNLPYNVAALILRNALESTAPPRRIVAMVQLEVAEAIVAAPPRMTLIGVATQVYGEPRLVMRVPPGAFHPPPKVHSAVVRIDVAERPRVDVPLQPFFRIVRAGFGNPRKMLRNSLSFGLHVRQERIDAALAVAGVDPSLRAQALSLEQWASITRAWLDRPDQ